MRSRFAIAIGSVVAFVAASSVLAADSFEPRSRLLSGRAVATNFSITLSDFHALAEAAKRKYGSEAKSALQGNGRVETKLDGKVVETASIPVRVQEVFGMLLVGPRREAMARFPFSLRVSGNDRPNRDVGDTVRKRFATQAPHLVDFHDFDWVNLWCWSQPKPDAGPKFAQAQPQLGKAELCLVRWRRGDPKVMLIGALAADGGDWVRDASRPICRRLIDQWLDMPEVSARESFVDYAACVLVHDPDRGGRGARETVVEHIYEVHPDHSLLAIH